MRDSAPVIVNTHHSARSWTISIHFPFSLGLSSVSELIWMLSTRHLLRLPSTRVSRHRVLSHWKHTRVGTLIVATIYLQLIQNRYMQSPALCTTRCQRCGSRRIPLAAPVVLIIWMERSTAWRISGTVLKRIPRSGSFILGIKWKLQGLKPLWLPLDS